MASQREYSYPHFSVEDLQDVEQFVQKNHDLYEILSPSLSPALQKLYADVLARALPFYAAIPYHNHPHHLTVTHFAILIALSLGKSELLPVLIIAGLWHDAGYDHDHQALGYKTKEDYSIALMREHETAAGTDPDLIDMAADAIEGTKIHNTDYSTEGRNILRAADIRGLGGEFDIFEVNTFAIKNEYEKLHNTSLPLDLFVEKQADILSIFATQSDLVPEEYFMMNGMFYEQFRSNIERLHEKYGK